MCNYPAPKQYAYIDPAGKFQRLGARIDNKEQMESCRRMIHSKAAYESVYGWKGWHGGKINAEISKTAVIDGIFLDFDDAEEPQKAIRDAAEVAAYVGHCTCNFSGAKGAHVLIHCHAVDLIPDLKSSVLRGFANMLGDRLPELSTMDWSVIGDTSRVHRIIDSVHPGTKLHAIGLTIEELATFTIDEIKEMATNRRRPIQVPEPSQWVTDELYRIEGEILHDRMNRLIDSKIISTSLANKFINDIYEGDHRKDVYSAICLIGDELRRIKAKQLANVPITTQGRSPEENWLLRVVEIFKVVQRMNSIQPAGSMVSTSPSEHEARCHITKLMQDCNWTRPQMHEVFSHADDYKYEKTERMINSLIGRA